MEKPQLQVLFKYLRAFIRNPVEEIRRLPEIDWKTLVLFQFALCSVSVGISNLLAPFAISITSVIISLVASILAIGLASLFFYYFFLILYDQTFEFIKLFSLVLFANIPFAIFHLASAFFPPADLLGYGISGILMIVGLSDNFDVPRKLATRLVISLYAILSIYWVIHMITMQSYSREAAPQNLDQIEQEIQDDFQKIDSF